MSILTSWITNIFHHGHGNDDTRYYWNRGTREDVARKQAVNDNTDLDIRAKIENEPPPKKSKKGEKKAEFASDEMLPIIISTPIDANATPVFITYGSNNVLPKQICTGPVLDTPRPPMICSTPINTDPKAEVQPGIMPTKLPPMVMTYGSYNPVPVAANANSKEALDKTDAVLLCVGGLAIALYYANLEFTAPLTAALAYLKCMFLASVQSSNSSATVYPGTI